VFIRFAFRREQGPQQGDPLGPLLFCLTVMALVKRIKSQCNIWYMDDGTMGDDVNTLLADFQLLVVEGRKLGLVVNVAKCEIITDTLTCCRSSGTSHQTSSTSSQYQPYYWGGLLKFEYRVSSLKSRVSSLKSLNLTL